MKPLLTTTPPCDRMLRGARMTASAHGSKSTDRQLWAGHVEQNVAVAQGGQPTDAGAALRLQKLAKAAGR